MNGPLPHRVILLGASNLTRGFRTVIEVARARLGAPLEVFAALGHGRSYGPEPSSFLGRTLPGIQSSGLWTRLAAEQPRPARALVTDLGNDIAFGAAPARVAGWLETALDRLEAAGARPVITGLPLGRLEALDPFWFGFWRRLFFPGRDLERERVLDAARELEAAAERLARARGLAFVPARGEWYGRDPIHYGRARERAAFEAILASWGDGAGARPLGRIPLPAAAESSLFGLRRTRAQPAARLADGSALSVY
jgi:hypothetical protein